MNLKEQMLLDVATILNPAEFAEEICIDGVVTNAVCDWTAQPEGEHLYDTADAWGVNVLRATVCLTVGIIPLPEPGHELEINDKYWTARSATAAGGLLTLQLYRNIA